jgi:hypothetical protein
MEHLAPSAIIPDIIAMASARDLRAKATLCRKAASIRTIGSGDTDGLLMELANRLEKQAEELEHDMPTRRPTAD